MNHAQLTSIRQNKKTKINKNDEANNQVNFMQLVEFDYAKLNICFSNNSMRCTKLVDLLTNTTRSEKETFAFLIKIDRSAVQNDSFKSNENGNKLQYKPMFILFMYLVCSLILFVISLWTHYINKHNMKRLDELNTRCEEHMNTLSQQILLKNEDNLREQKPLLSNAEEERMDTGMETPKIPSILIESTTENSLN
jgi:hypothetical protein